MLSGFPSRARETVVILLATAGVVQSQTTWCGKNYKAGTPVVDPGGEYPTPEVSGPYFSFRCAPAIKPWIHHEDWMGTMLVDAENTNTKIAGAQPIRAAFDDRERFLVSFSVGGIQVGGGIVRLGLNQHIDFPLTLLPRSKPYDVTCLARRILHRDVFEATTQLFYLPANPYGGNVVKTDIATGGLLVKRERSWEPIFPFGFYNSFDNYLVTNLSIIDAAKARGYVSSLKRFPPHLHTFQIQYYAPCTDIWEFDRLGGSARLHGRIWYTIDVRHEMVMRLFTICLSQELIWLLGRTRILRQFRKKST